MFPEDELNGVVDCDVDLTDKLIQTLQSHEPMSVPNSKNMLDMLHLKVWANELDEKFETMHKKSDKSKLKIALRAEHEKEEIVPSQACETL